MIFVKMGILAGLVCEALHMTAILVAGRDFKEYRVIWGQDIIEWIYVLGTIWAFWAPVPVSVRWLIGGLIAISAAHDLMLRHWCPEQLMVVAAVDVMCCVMLLIAAGILLEQV